MPPPDLAAKAPLPAAGLREGDASAQMHWMNRVAMVLDDQLAASAAQAAAADAASPSRVSPSEAQTGSSRGRGAWAVSPSARFQALLVHARRKGFLQGYCDAMLQRCACLVSWHATPLPPCKLAPRCLFWLLRSSSQPYRTVSRFLK